MVVGAGAAGTTAAIFASRAGAAVTLVERTAEGGKKILVSGGGRCNILPAVLDPSRFVTDSSPNSLRKILGSWPLRDQRAWFERDLGIPLVEEPGTTRGGAKLFPRSQRARDVRDALLGAARSAGARVWLGTDVTGIEAPARDGEPWNVCTSAGIVPADAVVLATGGLSLPATGSDGRGLAFVRSLGVAVHEPYAALTPVHAPWGRSAGETAADGPYAALAGITLPDARVRAEDAAAGRRAESTGGFLFTHDGYSGPAVLDVSHVFVRAGHPDAARLVVSWTGADSETWTEILAARGGGMASRLRERLPSRLADAILAAAGVPRDRTPGTLRREERLRLLRELTEATLAWSGHAGYRKAEVTGGGVALSEVDARTLECRCRRGLHLCGEILDAFGPIGGHNFAWAWATGRAAGLGAAGAR